MFTAKIYNQKTQTFLDFTVHLSYNTEIYQGMKSLFTHVDQLIHIVNVERIIIHTLKQNTLNTEQVCKT